MPAVPLTKLPSSDGVQDAKLEFSGFPSPQLAHLCVRRSATGPTSWSGGVTLSPGGSALPSLSSPDGTARRGNLIRPRLQRPATSIPSCPFPAAPPHPRPRYCSRPASGATRARSWRGTTLPLPGSHTGSRSVAPELGEACFGVLETLARAPSPWTPPPWAGPGRLPRPAGGARPGAAPGSWPPTPRPFPAPFPLSSTPGVGDPEAPRALGQKPGDAVVYVVTAGVSIALGPLSCPPVRGPKSALLLSPVGCRDVPRYWQGWAPAPTPRASRLAELFGLATLLSRCLLSQDCFLGGLRLAHSPRAGALRPGQGAAPCRGPRSLSRSIPAPDPPTVRPLARFFLMQTAVH
uniref:translation initiation factor IF-2-like n=1 Tax=Arvicanthis niloticus TaxID=61156 RepID=UPI0014871D69|nr:translation initiation factor IF-2-like [Arvicanthis niloticus]